MTNAEICRRRGWGPQTIFHVEDEFGAARFMITAVGESNVLGKQLSSREFGFSWSTRYKSYEAVIGVSLENAKVAASATDNA
jgi:hypothetical protein